MSVASGGFEPHSGPEGDTAGSPLVTHRCDTRRNKCTRRFRSLRKHTVRLAQTPFTADIIINNSGIMGQGGETQSRAGECSQFRSAARPGFLPTEYM